jgi:hypothetical protein
MAKIKVQIQEAKNHPKGIQRGFTEMKQQQYGEALRTTLHKDGTISVYPDRSEYPVGTWWTYWPFFLLSVILDPLQQGLTWVTNLLRNGFDFIGLQFRIEG